MTSADTALRSEHLHILQHSLGLDRYGQGNPYRNHFVTGAGATDYPLCTALVTAGLMTRRAGNELTGGDDCFHVTDAGRVYVTEHSEPAPKLTRSQQRYLDFLNADSGMRFGEWLRMRAP